MTEIQKAIITISCALIIFATASGALFAIDSELTRQTLVNVKGVSVVIEELQPDIQKYAPRFGLTKGELQKDIEERLAKSGLAVLKQEQWLKTSGRPILYISINTHESEKYWYAYTIIVDFRQLVTLEASPNMKTLASTWSVDMAGVANIGNLNLIRNNVGVLVDRFIEARQSIVSKGK
ncbi:MAG TPA: hypothetical protein VMT62_09960 [Syntrophorhabdaceae bacterium]|nr:hypothetical protein [Syntrophorhabdaceae bacterium]